MNAISKLKFITSISVFSLAGFVFAADHPAASLDADAALAKLKEGNARFAATEVSTGKPTAAKRAETANGQHPFAIILACADSRTAPEIIFDENIGDLFVIPTAGNLVDEHALGSIEYAVEHLGTPARRCSRPPASRCGYCRSGQCHRSWSCGIPRSRHPTSVQAEKGKPGDVLENTVAENARLVAAQIRKQAELGEAAKDVRIIPAVYNLDTGRVELVKD